LLPPTLVSKTTQSSSGEDAVTKQKDLLTARFLSTKKRLPYENICAGFSKTSPNQRRRKLN
jgi:hypothetical protein